MVVLHCRGDRIPLDRIARASLEKCLESIAMHPWWIQIGVVNAIRRILAGQHVGDNDGKEFRNSEERLPRTRWRAYYVEYQVTEKSHSDRLVLSQDGHVYFTPTHYRDFVILQEPGAL